MKSQKQQKQPTEDEQINAYLARRLKEPGNFARTGWQTWQHLLIHHPADFPVSMDQFLQNCISPLLVPVCSSSLELMLQAWQWTYDEHMLSSSLVPYGSKKELTQEQRREKKWENLTSLMSTSLTRSLLNHHASTIASVRSVE